MAEAPAIRARTVTAAGHRIHLIEAGAGPLVLLLHGFPETSHSWRRQLPVLAAAGYRAVAIDQLGYGRSARPDRIDEYRITRLVDVAAGVVEALGESSAIVVGHDWGAPVAWSAAWTRPDVFAAVVGVGVPFGGRGLWGFPTSPFGERRPSEVGRDIAGPDLVFYQEYFQLPGLAEQELDADAASWLRDIYYSFSARPLPPGASAPDLAALDADPAAIMPLLRQTGLCMAPGTRMSDRFERPDVLPDWLTQEDLDHYVGEFERTGMTGAFNYYRCCDLDWELLAAFEGRPVEVPALFIGADRDAPTLWAREALARMAEHVPLTRGAVIVEDCGHWIQQERPERFHELLLGFLADVAPVG
jgi:pimeloyl-ACP methyl ester carboxylesterase